MLARQALDTTETQGCNLSQLRNQLDEDYCEWVR